MDSKQGNIQQLLVFSTWNLCDMLNPVSYIELKMNQWKFLTLLFLLSFLQSAHSQCCTQFQDGICVGCPNGMHLYRDNCIFDLPNCQDYQNGFDCRECAQGYEINQDGKCSELPPQIIEDNVVEFEDNEVTLQIFETVNLGTSQLPESQETAESAETINLGASQLAESQGATRAVESSGVTNLRQAEQIVEEQGNGNLTLSDEADEFNRTRQEIEDEKSFIVTSLRAKNAGLTAISEEEMQEDEKFLKIDIAVREIPYVRSTLLLIYFDYGLQSISLFTCYYWDPNVDTVFQILVVWNPVSSTPQLEGVSEINI